MSTPTVHASSSAPSPMFTQKNGDARAGSTQPEADQYPDGVNPAEWNTIRQSSFASRHSSFGEYDAWGFQPSGGGGYPSGVAGESMLHGGGGSDVVGHSGSHHGGGHGSSGMVLGEDGFADSPWHGAVSLIWGGVA